MIKCIINLSVSYGSYTTCLTREFKLRYIPIVGMSLLWKIDNFKLEGSLILEFLVTGVVGDLIHDKVIIEADVLLLSMSHINGLKDYGWKEIVDAVSDS